MVKIKFKQKAFPYSIFDRLIFKILNKHQIIIIIERLADTFSHISIQ
jgi:hypothetical protein